MKCLKNGVCLGGFESKCAEGYQGKLCTECIQNDEKYYARSSQFSCSKCLSLDQQIIILIVLIIAITIYIVYLHQQANITYLLNLYSSLIKNSKRNNPQTLLIRILTNYFQVIMLVKNFELNWPSQVQQTLDYLSLGGEGYSQVLSFDCFLRESGFEITMQLLFFKLLLNGFLPIFLSLIAFVIWGIAFFSDRYKFEREDLKRNMITSFILFGYLCYPQISSSSFSLFSCLRFENGLSYLRQDMQIQCWTSQHYNMTYMIGVTFILFWAFIFPLFILIQLFRNRKDLNGQNIVTQYGLFYSGLKDQYFYWEVLYVNLKKLLFIIFSSLLSQFSTYLRALFLMLVLFIEIQISHNINPYIDEKMNYIDRFASLVSILTIFSGIFFLNNDTQNYQNFLTILFILILVVNLTFLAHWFATFLKIIIRVNYNKLSKFFIFLKRYKLLSYEEELMIRQNLKNDDFRNYNPQLQSHRKYSTMGNNNFGEQIWQQQNKKKKRKSVKKKSLNNTPLMKFDGVDDIKVLETENVKNNHNSQTKPSTNRASQRQTLQQSSRRTLIKNSIRYDEDSFENHISQNRLSNMNQLNQRRSDMSQISQFRSKNQMQIEKLQIKFKY